MWSTKLSLAPSSELFIVQELFSFEMGKKIICWKKRSEKSANSKFATSNLQNYT